MKKAPPRKDKAQEAVESFSSIGDEAQPAIGKFQYEIIRIPPFHYLHVLDNNANVVRVVEGPSRYTCLGHEKVLLGPEPMVVVPPRHYATIENPVIKDDEGKIVLDKYKQAKLRHGETEIRFEQDPFPLYPGERLGGLVQPLVVVAENTALRLRAVCDFEDYPLSLDDEQAQGKGKEKKGAPVKRFAGEEWLFEGPRTYYPRVEVTVVEVVRALVLNQDQALHLRANRDFIDREGNHRKAGEEWLVRKPGAYLPDVNEKLVACVTGYLLTDKKALHLRARFSYTDIYGQERKAGEEWLVTRSQTEVHIPDVYEEVVGTVAITSLTNRQYCVVLNPMKNGVSQLGSRELRRGPLNFFLQPGEAIEKNAISEVFVLAAEDALQMRAREAFDDVSDGDGRGGRTIRHRAGAKWMVYGPCEYTPPLEAELVKRKRAFVQLEGLNVYLFNPEIVVAVVVFILFAIWFLGRALSGGGNAAASQEL